MKLQATIAMILIIPISIPALAAQKSQQECEECKLGPEFQARLSQSVVTTALNGLVSMKFKYERGTLTSSDIRTAAVGIKLLRDHFDEIGLTVAMDKSMRSARPRIVNHVATIEEAQAIQSKMRSNGVSIPLWKILATMQKSPMDREAAFNSLDRQGGVRGSLNAILIHLRIMDKRLTSSRYNSPRLRYVAAQVGDFWEPFPAVPPVPSEIGDGLPVPPMNPTWEGTAAPPLPPAPSGAFDPCLAESTNLALFTVCCFLSAGAEAPCCIVAAAEAAAYALCELTGGAL